VIIVFRVFTITYCIWVCYEQTLFKKRRDYDELECQGECGCEQSIDSIQSPHPQSH